MAEAPTRNELMASAQFAGWVSLMGPKPLAGLIVAPIKAALHMAR